MTEVFFVSNGEINADENWDRLLDIVPDAIRIDGVDGIHQAHHTCAKEAFEDRFFVVDADNWIVDGFEFALPDEVDPDAVYVWRAKNPVNDLVYGHGAIKSFPRSRLLSINPHSVDMTTSVSLNYRIVHVLASEHRFNVSPYDSWRTAFRECVKLSSRIIDRQNEDETVKRLQTWCSVGEDRPFGLDCITGAVMGSMYGETNKDNVNALKKINDFNFLACVYDDH
jgi:hypothetical protein